MKDYYEVLGLKEGAAKTEIKKAYFKLIRQHSPEKDPDGFREIREAYEALSREGDDREKGYTYELPGVPLARSMHDRIEEYLRTGKSTSARDMAEEAVKYFPETAYFRYRLVRAQREAGNTGKAVKNADILVKQEPENGFFWMELAYSCLERGFIRRAYTAFAKAYELGSRSTDFLLMYAVGCREYGDYARGVEILRPLVKEDYKWKNDEMAEALEVYAALSFLAPPEQNPEFLEAMLRFFGRYESWLASQSADFMIIATDFLLKGSVPGDSPLWTETIRIFEKMIPNTPDALREKYRHMIRALPVGRIQADHDIPKSVQFYYKALVLSEMNRFELTDLRLCMIEERNQIFRVEEKLKATYPELYADIEGFLGKIRSDNEAQVRKYELLQDYLKLLEFYDGGYYFEWFPEEREKAVGKRVSDGESTYVRIGKKIGRNDPCPCGSGKKYKQCCMRKS